MSGRASRSNPRLNRFSGDSNRLAHMNQALQRINGRIESKLREHRHEAEANGQLMARATRLTERLEILRHKLRLCFDLNGDARPANLQIVLKQMADVDPDDAPPEFVCPITQCIMVDPVLTSDGGTYDRAAIVEWFGSFHSKDQVPTSPLTNLLLPDTALTPHTALRQRIMAFLRAMEQQGAATTEEPSVRIVPQSLLRGQDGCPLSSAAASTSTPTQHAAASSARDPIWSSAVVPMHEANSRELNLLRVSDFDVPASSESIAAVHQPSHRSNCSLILGMMPASSSLVTVPAAAAASASQRVSGPPVIRHRFVSPGVPSTRPTPSSSSGHAAVAQFRAQAPRTHPHASPSQAPRAAADDMGIRLGALGDDMGMLVAGHMVHLPTSSGPPRLVSSVTRRDLYEMPSIPRGYGASRAGANLNTRRRTNDSR